MFYDYRYEKIVLMVKTHKEIDSCILLVKNENDKLNSRDEEPEAERS